MKVQQGVKQPSLSLEECFPLAVPRKSQTRIIEEISKAYKDGYRFVILEAPVGSGKSAIAITLARYFGKSHIITPRKSLQNQYFEDFSEHLVLMKGRASYPCTFPDTNDKGDLVRNMTKYTKVIRIIQTGTSPAMSMGEDNCAGAPCVDNLPVYNECVDMYDTGLKDSEGESIKEPMYPCPYKVAIEVAQKHDHIVHNLHSFVYQTHFAERFGDRGILIIDEAHEVENMVRDFISKAFSLPIKVTDTDWPTDFSRIMQWCDWLLPFQSHYDNTQFNKAGRTARQEYVDRVEAFRKYDEIYENDFVVRKEDIQAGNKHFTKVNFIPVSIGSAAQNFIFEYGEKVLLMSGTIYSKDMFCKNLGINPEEAYFIRTSSSFPVESRPIYMKAEYLVDTSHAKWVENYPTLIEKISTIMGKFPDVKGLIHAPSYVAGQQMANSLHDRRVMTHDKMNFFQRLEEFMRTTDPRVFISPVCSQGIDFKDDRARFQIIVRVPYPNTNDPFLAHKVKTDFPWFNYQALITFGQQIGRINRSESDFGVTILLDERFIKFLSRNKKQFPMWVKEAIIT
jgi:ATP-dependent DNA helicase DinG